MKNILQLKFAQFTSLKTHGWLIETNRWVSSRVYQVASSFMYALRTIAVSSIRISFLSIQSIKLTIIQIIFHRKAKSMKTQTFFSFPLQRNFSNFFQSCREMSNFPKIRLHSLHNFRQTLFFFRYFVEPWFFRGWKKFLALFGPSFCGVPNNASSLLLLLPLGW